MISRLMSRLLGRKQPSDVPLVDKSGKALVAAVTGAGSGIGRALAVELARRGARLALSDIDADGLQQTRAAAEAAGAEVHTKVVDVADQAAVAQWATDVISHYGVVHQLYNNAGVAGGGELLEAEYADYQRIIDINLWGVIHGSKEFLPHLIASGRGALINISSLNGFLAQPGLGAYCASKFAVRGLTETIRAEMLAERHPVTVHVVHPGGVQTQIASSALEHSRRIGKEVTAEDEAWVQFYNETLFRTTAESAASTILDGVAARKPRILVGRDARQVDTLVRLAPALAVRSIVRLSKRMERSAEKAARPSR